MKIRIFQKGDKVILDLGGRRQDLLLSPFNAMKVADALEEGAAIADTSTPELVTGQTWNMHVRSFDRMVAIRFYSPDLLYPSTVPMSPDVARWLVKKLRENAMWAGYGLRVVPTTIN